MKLLSALVYCPLNLHSRISSLKSIVEVTEYLKMNFKPVFSRWFDIGVCNAFKCFCFFFTQKNNTKKKTTATKQITYCHVGLAAWFYWCIWNKSIQINIRFYFFPTSNDVSALCICFSFLKNLLKYPARHTSVNVNG